MPKKLAVSKFKSEFVPALITCLSHGYSLRQLKSDVAAGITVGIIALPLAMAFAIASGLSPDRGLWTAIIAGFLIAFLGGSRFQIGGPTGAFVVIVSSVAARHGYDGLATATLMAGVMLIIFGLCRFGSTIKFIPYPVIAGFTTGIAIIIFTSQVKDFLGLSIPNLPGDFSGKWRAYLDYASTINPSALAISLVSLLLLVLLRGRNIKIPATLLVIVLASLAAKYFHLDVETIGSRFGDMPRNLPERAGFDLSLARLRLLFPDALTIAFLGAVESLLSAVIADGMTGGRHRSNCELVGQGTANIAAILCGGMPATGAIARTATNVRSGAQTPIAGIIHALTILGVVFFASGLAQYVPLCALAAILFMACWNMSDIDHFRFLLRAPKGDVVVLLTTFFLTIFVDLTAAVEAGVVIASLVFVKRMSEASDAASELNVFQDAPDDALIEDERSTLYRREIPAGVQVFQMKGPFFFGAAEKVKDVLHRLDVPPKVFILRMRKVPFIDATGLHGIRDLLEKCRREGSILLVSGIQPRVESAMRRIGLHDQIGADNFCVNIDHALARAEAIIAKSAGRSEVLRA